MIRKPEVGRFQVASLSSTVVASGPSSFPPSLHPSTSVHTEHSPHGAKVAAADPVIISHQDGGSPR